MLDGEQGLLGHVLGQVGVAQDPLRQTGEYRLWEDPLGRARTAQPGERVQLWIIDLEPGIVVLDAAFLPTADASRVRELMAMADATWIGVALVR